MHLCRLYFYPDVYVCAIYAGFWTKKGLMGVKVGHFYPNVLNTAEKELNLFTNFSGVKLSLKLFLD